MRVFIALILSITFAQAQLITTPLNNANQLAQILAGPGVTILNPTINCPGLSAGTFVCQNCNVGISSGILLTSGDVAIAQGPNNSGSAGVDNMAPGYNPLNNLAGSTTFDACMLEFDFQVQSDSVEFKYVFGSEEYLEWVNSSFNDAFAFYISGPGIIGQQNIALIPGTAMPVTIDNVNNMVNSQYYVNNGTGFTPPQNTSNYYIQYDGFTTVLTAKRKNLQPCQTYHLRLVIADAGDGIYDSGVFLAENSLTSNFVSLDDAETDVPNTVNAMEGCVNGLFRFRLQYPVSHPINVNYTIGGTATNGVDYNQLNGTITIPAGQTTATIPITAFSDGIVETNESIILYLNSPCNNLPYDSAVLIIVDSLPFIVGPDTTICAGQSVQLTGSLASTYNWSPASTLSAANIYNPIATPTSTTVYRCSATIGNCLRYDSAIVTVISPPFSVNAGPDITSCSGAPVTIQATVSGNQVGNNPFTYNWSPANGLSNTSVLNPQANPPNPTTYVVEVSSGGCVARDSVRVIVGNIGLNIQATPQTCHGVNDGSVTTQITAGTNPITYQWSNNATTPDLTNVPPGTYAVTISDALGCTASASAQVTAAAPIVFTQNIVQHVSCHGGNDGIVNFSASGSNAITQYNWNNNLAALSPNQLPAGTYTVTVTDAKGCTAETSFTINEPPALALTTQITNVNCHGAATGIASVTGSGGTIPYSFLWNNGAQTPQISNLIAGTYSVTLSDANNCSITANINITQPSAPLEVNLTAQNQTCYGYQDASVISITTGGTPVYSFMWSTGQNSQSIYNILPGSYQLTVTDSKGCTASAAASVAAAAPIVFDQPVLQHVSCYGGNDGSMSVNASGGTGALQFTWNIGGTGPAASSLSAGTYYVTATDANACTATVSATVTQPTMLQAFIQTTDITCYGYQNGTATVVVTGGTQPYTYQWNHGATTPYISGLSASIYQITVTDANACSITALATINEPDELNVIPSATPVSCTYSNDGTISTTVNNGLPPYQYALLQNNSLLQLNSNGFFEQLSAATYTVSVTDANGCTANASVNIPLPSPDAFIFSTDSTSCYGEQYQDGSLHIQVLSTFNQPYYFNLDNKGNQLSPDFYFLAPGPHVLVVTNKNGCVFDTTIIIHQPPPLQLNIVPSDTFIQLGEQITLHSVISGYGHDAVSGYMWYPALGLSCTDCANTVMQGYVTTTYTLTVTYNEGCTVSASATIKVGDPPPVFIPNAFTPNGDGNNDLFMVYGENISTVQLLVFNRWGEVVFDSQKSQHRGWDGTYKGETQNPGVYTYTAEITYLNGQKTIRKGSVTLLR
ncbi:MAG: choice-of-anchor L domain-containing protein [Chitinophagales bacterium]|nr:choice-of-anchor L domain-containing protein [Chitinophagales bacterium]MDW8418710.1 choice-of-anchor L domain-containing protein [Chitinophagales bacterium]